MDTPLLPLRKLKKARFSPKYYPRCCKGASHFSALDFLFSHRASAGSIFGRLRISTGIFFLKKNLTPTSVCLTHFSMRVSHTSSREAISAP